MSLYSWFSDSKHSLYGAAIARMLLGLTVAVELAVNFSDRNYTWGAGAGWTDGVRKAESWPGAFYLVFGGTHGLLFDLAYVATIIVALLMVAGFWTRATTIVTLFLWMSLYVTNPFVGSGGDSVLRMVMFYLCFMDAGRVWSIDSRLRRRSGPLRVWVRREVTNALHNSGVVLILHQVIVVYVMSALWKVQSEQWMSGTAVYYPLHVQAYSPWRDYIDLLTDHGAIVQLATFGAIALQLLIPVLVIYRPSRVFALIAILGMHLGIGLLMGLLFFSTAMIAADALLISDKSWALIAAKLRTMAGSTRWRGDRALRQKVTHQ